MTTEIRGRRGREATAGRVQVIAVQVIALVALTLLAGCDQKPRSPALAGSPRTALQTWTLPVQAAMQHDLVAAPDGSLLLSWVEKDGNGEAFRFSRYRAGAWSAPLTIASGDWFGNSSDTPHLRQTVDGALWAVWLRKTPGAGHARDIVLARSPDGGASWSMPVPVNDDGTPTEHGFVSLWAARQDSLGIAWLDGRAKANAGREATHRHHPDAATMLRAARFDARLHRSGEAVIDAATCDCCHTDVAETAGGPVLVYRGRTSDEVRDIAVTRLQAETWAAPALVHADGWVMPACPINGPAAGAHGGLLAVGWYTAPGDVPAVRVALSRDGGVHFNRPLEVDRAAAVLGRVDVALDGGATPWVTWLREDGSGQSLWLARIGADGANVQQRIQVARLAGRGRGTGMPRLVAADRNVFLAWTDVVAGRPQLQGRVLHIGNPLDFADAR